jgi:hypothetical protein
MTKICKLPQPTQTHTRARLFPRRHAAVQGRQIERQYEFMRRWLRSRIDKANWLLWHGRQEKCLRLQSSLLVQKARR